MQKVLILPKIVRDLAFQPRPMKDKHESMDGAAVHCYFSGTGILSHIRKNILTNEIKNRINGGFSKIIVDDLIRHRYNDSLAIHSIIRK